MNDSQQLCESMWDLVYGLLSDEESTQLIDRIKSDPQAARLYAEVRLQADLVAAAAKVDDPALTFQVPSTAPPLVEKAKPPHPSPRVPKARTQRLFTALAAIGATALAALLACGLFWKSPSAQQPLVAVEVLGSAAMPAGLSRQVTIRTVAINPASALANKALANLELRLLAADGSQLLSQSISPEANGEATIDLPGDLLQPGVQLEVTRNATLTKANAPADSDKSTAASAQILVRTALPVQPEPQLAYVLCAEPTVAPGQAVDFSLWNFAAFSNTPSPPAEATQAAESVAGLSIEPAPPASAKQGLVNARLQVPRDEAEPTVRLPSDAYLLQRSAGQAFTPAEGERLRREVLAESAQGVAPPANQLRRLADNRRAPLPRSALRQFSPAKQQEAEKITSKESTKSFELAEPQSAALPALNGSPANSSDVPTIAAGQPILVPLDPALANRSLFATAVCRGVTVSTMTQEPQPEPAPGKIAASKAQPRANELQLDLPPEADGLIEVFVYDRASGEPLLAEQRDFYREPLRKLNIQLAGDKPRFVPGERVQLQVQVTDEKGQPAPNALVGVRVWNELTLAKTDQQPILLEDAVRNGYVGEQSTPPTAAPTPQIARDGQSQDRKLAILERSSLPQSGQRASGYFVQPPTASVESPQPAKREDRAAAPAQAIAKDKLDAVLNDQPPAPSPSPSAETPAWPTLPTDAETVALAQPVLLATNRQQVTAAAARAQTATAKAHQQWLSALGYTAMIGGILVLAALAISAAQRSLPNIAIAAPTLLAAAASIVIGIGWIGQQPASQRAAIAAAAATTESPASAPASATPPPATPASATSSFADAQATVPTAALAEKSQSPPTEPPAPRYGALAGGGLAGAAPQSNPAIASAASGRAALATPNQQAPTALYFNPQLATDALGHAEIDFVAPQVESEYRVLVDALGRGRVGSYQQQLIIGGPESAK